MSEHERDSAKFLARLERDAALPAIPDAAAILDEAERRGLLGRGRRRRTGTAGLLVVLALLPGALWWIGPSEAGPVWVEGFKEKSRIVVEGILLFALPSVRDAFYIKLYVDTDADIRVFRRIRRDIRQRGRDFESIRAQYYQTVRPMHLQFVEPSKRWADLIIPEGGNNHIALDVIIERLKRFP